MLVNSEPLHVGFIILALLLGIIWGNFLYRLIKRIPIMMENAWNQQIAELRSEPYKVEPYGIFSPKSQCSSCKSAINFLQSISTLRFMMFKGGCQKCSGTMGLKALFVEISTAVLFACAAVQWELSITTLWAMVIISALIVLTMIDIATMMLPDEITLPLMWLGILCSLLSVGFVSLSSSVIGAMAGYLSLWTVFWLFKIIRGKEGMGYGDFKLFAALGAWFGWQALAPLLVMSAITGSLIGISMLAMGKQGMETQIPFGPYLAGGGLMMLFFGAEIMSWIF